MGRPKRDQLLRHETFGDEEDSFVTPGESGIRVVNPGLPSETPLSRGKGKRSVEDMMASMPSPPAQSVYALERVASLEDQIAKVLTLCSKEALEIVLKQRPSLRRYAPQE
jgi:hypothetical protein